MVLKKVIFMGKTKKKTGNTRFMFKALERQVKHAFFINLPRYKKKYFWTNYEKVIYKKILNINPDLILIYSKDIPYEVLQNIHLSFKTAIFYPDLEIPVSDKIVQYGRFVNYMFITNKSQLGELKEKGVANPIFCMQGCDSEEHRIIPTQKKKWASQVAFIGRPNNRYRIKLFHRINKNYDFKAWGARWQDFGLNCLKEHIYVKEYAKICYTSKIIIGCDYRHDIEGYFSNRTWITLGCGGFLLTNYFPGIENVFRKGVHLEWYHTEKECLELIDYYLRHENQRKKIAQSGHEFVHYYRTYDVVIKEILSYIERDLGYY